MIGGGGATADLLSLDNEDPRDMDTINLYHPSDKTKYRTLNKSGITEIEPLLVEVLRDGKLVYELPPIEKMRDLRQADIGRLDAGVKRLVNPHIYHVSLTQQLWNLKQSLIESVKKGH